MRTEQVCQLTGIRPYVLRFWESEFPEIAPTLDPNGHKIYREEDVKKIFFIKKLLFEDKLSIDKVRLKIFELEEEYKERTPQVIKSAETKNVSFSFSEKEHQLEMKKKLQGILERLDYLQQMLH
jgi:DNA-binding transcriptional MerR regulator